MNKGALKKCTKLNIVDNRRFESPSIRNRELNVNRIDQDVKYRSPTKANYETQAKLSTDYQHWDSPEARFPERHYDVGFYREVVGSVWGKSMQERRAVGSLNNLARSHAYLINYSGDQKDTYAKPLI